MEYIKAGGKEYAAKTVTTSTNSISFTLEDGAIAEIEEALRNVTELEVSGEDKVTYGTYDDLRFESATVHEDGSITVTMHIPSATEKRLSALEASQAEQDDAIADLYGGGNNE
jgi:uncharacterized Zn finger protein